MKKNWQQAEKILNKDGIIVLPTDTLYGIIGRALSKKSVERIYKIKGRDKSKPFIVLITSYKDIALFGIKIKGDQAKILGKFWPGKVSVILPCTSSKWQYLHRGTKGIAFRMIGIKNKNLFNLIKKTGPLVAPSVNLQSEKPAENIKEAKKYFDSDVDLYINAGIKKSKPSTLIKLENNEITILRQGSKKIK